LKILIQCLLWTTSAGDFPQAKHYRAFFRRTGRQSDSTQLAASAGRNLRHCHRKFFCSFQRSNIRHSTPRQSGLTSNQVVAMSLEQFNALSKYQVSALTSKQFASLDPPTLLAKHVRHSIAAISPTAIFWINPAS